MFWNRDPKRKQNLHGPQRQHSTQVCILNPRSQTEGEKKCTSTTVVHKQNANENCREESTRQHKNDQNLEMKIVERRAQGNAEMIKTCLGEHRPLAKLHAHKKCRNLSALVANFSSNASTQMAENGCQRHKRCCSREW